MYKIQLYNNISDAGLEKLKPEKYDVGDEHAHPEGIVLRSEDLHKKTLDDTLLGVARAGAGTNNIPVDTLSQQGTVVFNTPGGNANAVKELVVEALLLSSRQVYPAMQWVQTLKGKGDEMVTKLTEKNKSKYAGPELAGKTLGVIGLGAIGIQVANIARHFQMEVYGYDPYITIENAWQLDSDVHYVERIEEIFENSDFITLHVPLTHETRHMIDSTALDQMKEGVRMMNFSRGELVNNRDLVDAVISGKMRVYITDFPSDDILGYSNILVLPHLGASTPESVDNCARMACRQLAEFLENGNIRNAVNLPDIAAPRKTIQRLTVFHKNIPAMISGISGAVGKNINNLINDSQGEYAYTIIDVDQPVSEETIEAIRQIDGVIRVRVLQD